MVQGIGNPQPERRLGKKLVFLTECIQLGISVQESCRNELVENADYKWWESGEKDIIE